jgi:hypothetical protein
MAGRWPGDVLPSESMIDPIEGRLRSATGIGESTGIAIRSAVRPGEQEQP